jgi:hypothetical protein
MDPKRIAAMVSTRPQPVVPDGRPQAKPKLQSSRSHRKGVWPVTPQRGLSFVVAVVDANVPE